MQNISPVPHCAHRQPVLGRDSRGEKAGARKWPWLSSSPSTAASKLWAALCPLLPQLFGLKVVETYGRKLSCAGWTRCLSRFFSVTTLTQGLFILITVRTATLGHIWGPRAQACLQQLPVSPSLAQSERQWAAGSSRGTDLPQGQWEWVCERFDKWVWPLCPLFLDFFTYHSLCSPELGETIAHLLSYPYWQTHVCVCKVQWVSKRGEGNTRWGGIFRTQRDCPDKKSWLEASRFVPDPIGMNSSGHWALELSVLTCVLLQHAMKAPQPEHALANIWEKNPPVWPHHCLRWYQALKWVSGSSSFLDGLWRESLPVGERPSIPQALSQGNCSLFSSSPKLISLRQEPTLSRGERGAWQSSQLELMEKGIPRGGFLSTSFTSLSWEGASLLHHSHDGTSKPAAPQGHPKGIRGVLWQGLSAQLHHSPAPLGLPWKDDRLAQCVTTEDEIQPPAKFSLFVSSHGSIREWLCHPPVSTIFSPRPAGDSLPTPRQRGRGTWLSHFCGEKDKKQQFKAQSDISSHLLSNIWKKKQGKGKITSSCLEH